ncbi:hypothetical protein GCM10009133_16000 [Cocleimonas flava]|uniref:DUF680 domain-containing protein n=1 Tax=Cocleimonas flava TaxID=634765 RepID=A0A4R1EV33_9GAMM|nr:MULTISPECIES: hypothetical protein [Cocleimonas]MEB8434279.1 hypothetical protein [Cocleimonas sp. KMM 6892]MEC4717102.1 hypothetical protein [Cocleimonas sp. KMM 6895]MEC4746551.1 hypothetical protein [Cocleimonas sp. KMM 6896]TCJ84530.1 hypothetical protein EV695_2487 [Cocleimonas flava]
MNTKAIIASTLLTTALIAGQSAIAGQNADGFFNTEASAQTTDKVNYSAPNAKISAELDAELFPQGEGQ